ncbi:MAG: sugar transferase [Acidobacteria bacterium]|nr:sugar transferase [Acidobacteriota bacterium]
MPLVTVLIGAADAALAGGALIAAFVVREGAPVLSETAWAWSQEFVPYAGVFWFAMFVRVALLAYEGVYRFKGAFSYSREAAKVVKAVAVGSLLIVAWAFLFRGGYAFREFSYSRAVFLLDFAIALALFTAFHLLIRWAQATIRSRGVNLLPTLIVGMNAETANTIAELRDRLGLGYRVAGVVATEETAECEFAGVPIVGSFDDLPELIRRYGIQEVIITEPAIGSERLFDSMMEVGRDHRVEFRFAPKLFDLLPQKTAVEQIGVLPMVRLFREPLSDAGRLVKRVSDIIISLAAIVVLSPVLAFVALAVRRSSSGPIFFRQERVGMDGRVFLCLKFRTMFADSDEEIHREAYRKNISGEAAGEVFGKVANDPRITPAGRSIRRWSLDELPQLFNVVRGEMSIVGPRPPIPYEVEEYDIRHRKRLDMKPGITGLWQVSGRNRLTFEEMVALDIFYIENWSVWLDLKIIFLTLPAIFRGDGERTEQ